MVSREATLRRLLRLYPREWRAEHEEEMLGVLRDTAGHDGAPVTPAEALDLVHGAVRIRLRRAADARVWIATVALIAALIAVAGGAGVSQEFLATSLIVVLIPGTGVVYTVSSALAGGWRRGVFAAVGCTVGIVPHLLAAVLGLSGVMQAGATAFEVIRWIGVAYLVAMGVSMVRSADVVRLDGSGVARHESMPVVVRRGVLLNLLNPKLTLFFFAFLPQFLTAAPTRLDPRLLGLSGIFMAMTLIVFVGYAGASAVLRDRVLAAPRALRWVQRSLGALLVGFAARLAVADR